LVCALLAGCGSSGAPRSDGGAADGPSLRVLAGIPGRQGTVDGTGMLSLFSSPGGLVSDGAGNLYVTDAGSVRQIVIGTGAVTTLAGQHPVNMSADGTGPAAAFVGAYAIAYDGRGTLFVTDLQTIRKVVIATAEVTTLAGTFNVYGTADGTGAAATFTELEGIALDGQGNLFVTDIYGRNIRQVVIATGVVTTLAGSGAVSSVDGVGTAASFYAPYGLTYDGAGNLYLFDNGTIRKVVIATGAVTMLVGSPTTGGADGVGAAAGLGSQGDVKSDGNGTLYVADSQNGAIRKVVIATRTVTTIVGVLGQHTLHLGPLPGGLTLPQTLAVVADGAIYLSDDSAILVAH
jgi:sugar lactone lactonase YvrE